MDVGTHLRLIQGGESSSTHFQCSKLMKTSTIKHNMADVGFETIFMFKYGQFEKHMFFKSKYVYYIFPTLFMISNLSHKFYLLCDCIFKGSSSFKLQSNL